MSLKARLTYGWMQTPRRWQNPAGCGGNAASGAAAMAGSGREQETPQVAQDSLPAQFKAAENSPLRGQRKIAVASCFFGKIGIR